MTARLSQQISDLTHAHAKIYGYVELGTPRGNVQRALPRGMRLRGPVTVARADAPLPSTMRPASVDLVVSPRGLSEVPMAQRHGFAASIAAVLRPGGSFITHVSDENEKALWAHHGLVPQGATSSGLVRLGRLPADNASSEEFLEALRRSMRLSVAHSEERRHRTNLPWDQWQHERVAHNRDSAPHTYPYIAQLGAMWSAFARAPTHVMATNTWHVMTASVELLAKAAAFAPLRLLPTEWVKRTEGMGVLATQQQEYADFTNSNPSFRFAHTARVPDLWRPVVRPDLSRLREWPVNVYVAVVGTLDCIAKELATLPSRWKKAKRDYSAVYVAVEDSFNRVKHLRTVAQVGGLKGLNVGRYRPLTEQVQQLVADGVRILAIAGNRRVPVTLWAPEGVAVHKMEGCKVISRSPMVVGSRGGTGGGHYVHAQIDVQRLNKLLPNFVGRGIEMKAIHDC